MWPLEYYPLLVKNMYIYQIWLILQDRIIIISVVYFCGQNDIGTGHHN